MDLDAIIAQVVRQTPAKKKPAKKPAAHQVFGLTSMRGILAKGGVYDLVVGKTTYRAEVTAFTRSGDQASVKVIDNPRLTEARLRARKTGRSGEYHQVEIKRSKSGRWTKVDRWSPAPSGGQIPVIDVYGVGQSTKLTCDGVEGCSSPVTHIDTKGYVYCSTHGRVGYGGRRSRKLTKAEIKTLEAGGTISYQKKKPAPKETPAQVLEQEIAKVEGQVAAQQVLEQEIAKAEQKQQKQVQLGLF
jgi:hypothetical protein